MIAIRRWPLSSSWAPGAWPSLRGAAVSDRRRRVSAHDVSARLSQQATLTCNQRCPAAVRDNVLQHPKERQAFLLQKQCLSSLKTGQRGPGRPSRLDPYDTRQHPPAPSASDTVTISADGPASRHCLVFTGSVHRQCPQAVSTGSVHRQVCSARTCAVSRPGP